MSSRGKSRPKVDLHHEIGNNDCFDEILFLASRISSRGVLLCLYCVYVCVVTVSIVHV